MKKTCEDWILTEEEYKSGKKCLVCWCSGEARSAPGKCANFVLARIDTGEDEIELYAEAIVPDGLDDWEEYGYDDLKAEIIQQAKSAGIRTEQLVFAHDEEARKEEEAVWGGEK